VVLLCSEEPKGARFFSPREPVYSFNGRHPQRWKRGMLKDNPGFFLVDPKTLDPSAMVYPWAFPSYGPTVKRTKISFAYGIGRSEWPEFIAMDAAEKRREETM